MTTLQAWGNSLGVRVPKRIINQLKLTRGSAVEISAKDNHIIITPKRRQYSLDQLLAGVTENNIHKEIDSGSAIGKEEF